MSSYPGRYRSRLFKFLRRKTRRWFDKGERATRNVQVATVWGVQVIVYPVYLLFQSVRLAGKQLQKALQRLSSSQESLNSLPADTPIQKVLETVQTFSLPATADKVGGVDNASGLKVTPAASISSNVQEGLSVSFQITNPSPSNIDTSKDRQIRGIATLANTRSLVLVNSQNQILDILTVQQQRKLQKQISLELANYWHHQHLLQKASQPNLYLPPPEAGNNALLPIRLFRQLMAWMQKGPIASAINLFQEETQQLNQEVKNQELQYRTERLKLKSQELKLKNQQLQLRNQNQSSLEPSTEEEFPTSPLIAKLDNAIASLETGSRAIVTQLPSYISNRSQEFVQLVKIRLEESSVTTEDSPNPKLKVQVLIKAAIEYFFGPKPSRKIPGQETQSRATFPPDAKSLEGDDSDSWLTEKELFPKPKNFKRKSKSSDLVVSANNTPTVAGKNKPSSGSISQKQLVSVPSETSDSASDWVETEATPTGYIKHPLQFILELLDRAILFIEELIVILWRLIRRLFRRLFKR